MLSFTLDTNCIIDLAENRPAAQFVRQLVNANATGAADVALSAITASEKQKGGRYLENFNEFTRRLEELGIENLKRLHPMLLLDVTFLDNCLLADQEMIDLEQKIHEVLFPCIEQSWTDYCTARGLSTNFSPHGYTWQNAKCDVQALWSHIHCGRDVFVTSDRNFHAPTKKPQLISLGAGQILSPEDAASLI